MAKEFLQAERGNDVASAKELRKFQEIQAGQQASGRELQKALRLEVEPETDEALDEPNR